MTFTGKLGTADSKLGNIEFAFVAVIAGGTDYPVALSLGRNAALAEAVRAAAAGALIVGRKHSLAAAGKAGSRASLTLADNRTFAQGRRASFYGALALAELLVIGTGGQAATSRALTLALAEALSTDYMHRAESVSLDLARTLALSQAGAAGAKGFLDLAILWMIIGRPGAWAANGSLTLGRTLGAESFYHLAPPTWRIFLVDAELRSDNVEMEIRVYDVEGEQRIYVVEQA
jgi:hypothetical protein